MVGNRYRGVLALPVNTLDELFGGFRLKIGALEHPRAVVKRMLSGKFTAFDSKLLKTDAEKLSHLNNCRNSSEKKEG